MNVKRDIASLADTLGSDKEAFGEVFAELGSLGEKLGDRKITQRAFPNQLKRSLDALGYTEQEVKDMGVKTGVLVHLPQT